MSIMVVALVGAVILTGFLPVLGATQENIGEPITKSNQTLDSYYRNVDANDVFELSTDGYELNDVLINKTYRQAVFADSFVLQINKPADTAIAYVIGSGNTNPVNLLNTSTYTITFNDSTITVVRDGSTTVFTKEFTWAYIITTSADTASWGTIARIGTDTAYILNDNQIILSGYYYTGENDTFYSYKDGVMYTGSFEGAIDIDKSITEGTTDIFKINGLEVTVGDESFTPYLTLVPLSVTGHATSGALYDVYGLIPLIVAIGLLMFVIVAILIRRV